MFQFRTKDTFYQTILTILKLFLHQKKCASRIVPTISITAVSSLLQYDNQQAFLIPNVFLEMTVP